MSVSGYKAVYSQRPSWLNFSKRMARTFPISLGVFAFSELVLFFAGFAVGLMGVAVGLALVAWGLSVRLAWPYRIICPYCSSGFSFAGPWNCPSCHASHGINIFVNCPTCSREHHAFSCPYCSKSMLLSQTSLTWDKELVDKHTARPVINGEPVYPPAPRVEPKPQPKPEPLDPVIKMMDEFVKSNLGRHEFIQQKREEVRQKYGDNPPEFVKDTMSTLENMIYKYREDESRGQR